MIFENLMYSASARAMRSIDNPVRPIMMTYNVTNRCNAKCVMCEIHEWKNNRADELSVEQIRNFFNDDYAKKMKIIRITGGEPFLRDDMSNIVGVIRDATECEILYVTTNGSFPERLDETVKSACGGRMKLHIQVSLDAMTDVHDELRGTSGIREKAVASLRKLSELKRSYDFYAGINQTVMKKTIDRIDEVNEFAKELKVGHSLFLGVGNHEGKSYDKTDTDVKAISFAPQDDMSIDDIKRFYEMHEKVKNSNTQNTQRKEYGTALLRDLSEEYLNMGGRNRLLKSKDYPKPPCMAMFTHFRMMPDGDITSCSYYRSDVVGNTKKDLLKTIWMSDKSRTLRHKVKRCPGCWIECDINPSIFFSGDILSWGIKMSLSDNGFRKKYLSNIIETMVPNK